MLHAYSTAHTTIAAAHLVFLRLEHKLAECGIGHTPGKLEERGRGGKERTG